MTHTRESAESVTLTINGTAREVRTGTSVADLLNSLEIDPRMVVVEHNREILRDRDTYRHRALAAGDVVEIVHFVGGG
ncbi:MAG TPA: sulfur carrier protein ThiS [Gemmatimonadaceae bacterium]|nr:sulfur carrier protein ThiS [Gemmatimonadaceae bacterium]